MLSHNVMLSPSFYMREYQPSSDQHVINRSAGLYRNKNRNELDDEEGRADTVETIVEAFVTASRQRSASTCKWGHDGALPELMRVCPTQPEPA